LRLVSNPCALWALTVAERRGSLAELRAQLGHVGRVIRDDLEAHAAVHVDLVHDADGHGPQSQTMAVG